MTSRRMRENQLSIRFSYEEYAGVKRIGPLRRSGESPRRAWSLGAGTQVNRYLLVLLVLQLSHHPPALVWPPNISQWPQTPSAAAVKNAQFPHALPG
jgi:hypothetical protein